VARRVESVHDAHGAVAPGLRSAILGHVEYTGSTEEVHIVGKVRRTVSKV